LELRGNTTFHSKRHGEVGGLLVHNADGYGAKGKVKLQEPGGKKSRISGHPGRKKEGTEIKERKVSKSYKLAPHNAKRTTMKKD